jgi:undecaprenyl-diphosphatase
MKKTRKRDGCIAGALLIAFAIFTLLVRTVDMAPIGPRGSFVGFATLNGFVHRCTGVHMLLYTITDWLGLVPIAVALGFAIFGLLQWIARRRIWHVDRSILVLGGFYLLVIASYILFEYVVVNRRPVLIDGYLEVSYPSSTTLLVTTVMPTAIMQLRARIGGTILRRGVTLLILAFTVFMVVGRLISGVHWLTDIIGGSILSAGLVMTYRALR